MFAGLPGTGIGGVFYLLLTLWMPIHELYLLWHGRSSLARWRFIAERWMLFSAVILVMVVQVNLLKGYFDGKSPTSASPMAPVAAELGVDPNAGAGILLGSGLYAGAVLLGVILLVHMVRLGFWYKAYFKDLAHDLDLQRDWAHVKAFASRVRTSAAIIGREVRVWWSWNVWRKVVTAR